jgi:hypothetical protein
MPVSPLALSHWRNRHRKQTALVRDVAVDEALKLNFLVNALVSLIVQRVESAKKIERRSQLSGWSFGHSTRSMALPLRCCV